MRTAPLVLALLLALPGTAAADRPAIKLGNVELRLGAAEKELMPKLRKSFWLEEMREGLYQVYEKEDAKDVSGIVQFRDEKLVWASRDLGAYEGQPSRDFGRALMAAVEGAKKGDEEKITISTQREGTPKYEVGVITLHFPERQIVLYVGRDGGAVDLSMEEIILVPPATP